MMVLLPTAKEIFPDAVPEVTGTLFTVTVAVGSSTVGVTVIVEVAFTTFSVKIVGTVIPFAKPALVLKDNNASFDERARLTPTL